MELRKFLSDFLGLFLVTIAVCSSVRLAEHPCDSAIYCYGSLLKTVQLAEIYNDSKAFVDQPLRFPPAIVEQNFNTFITTCKYKPTQNQIRDFVDSNFLPGGLELETWTPLDFKENPEFLNKIQDTNYREFGRKIHNLWKELGRKIISDVRNNPDKHSLIYVANPFIVPGGRFNEYYYWDSYWIQQGLLISGLKSTAKGMIQNFLDLVNQLGYVPNGGRVYYQRSQPPLLIPMFNNYYRATKDKQFLKTSLPTLQKEFDFWYFNRTCQVELGAKTYRMFHYTSEKTEPRPESYREDYMLASSLSTRQQREELYRNIHSTAESGWDFSTRWFIPGTKKATSRDSGSLIDTKIRYIIPVDLNSIMYYNAKRLAEYYLSLGNLIGAETYTLIATQLRTAINVVLWNDDLGSWFDYDILHEKIDQDFYPSTILPLWTHAAGKHSRTDKARRLRVYKYLKSVGILDFPGGVPTSLKRSELQWDFPNAWPPLQYFMSEGLDAYSELDSEVGTLPYDLAKKYVESTYIGYNATKVMFEKYDVQNLGRYGGGGEYVVQAGFGWTNGVLLHFLNKYGDRLKAPVIR